MAEKAQATNTKVSEREAPEINGAGGIRVILPLLPGSKDQTVEVGINGKFYMLKRGVPIDVSPEVAEVLTNAASAEMRYQELAAAIGQE